MPSYARIFKATNGRFGQSVSDLQVAMASGARPSALRRCSAAPSRPEGRRYDSVNLSVDGNRLEVLDAARTVPVGKDLLERTLVDDLELTGLERKARAGLGVWGDRGGARREDRDDGHQQALDGLGLTRGEHDLAGRYGERE